jgi:hypothetical protein
VFIRDGSLMITLTAEAARTLTVPQVLKFRLYPYDSGTGAVSKYQISTGAWTNLTPPTPGGGDNWYGFLRPVHRQAGPRHRRAQRFPLLAELVGDRGGDQVVLESAPSRLDDPPPRHLLALSVVPHHTPPHPPAGQFVRNSDPIESMTII